MRVTHNGRGELAVDKDLVLRRRVGGLDVVQQRDHHVVAIDGVYEGVAVLVDVPRELDVTLSHRA